MSVFENLPADEKMIFESFSQSYKNDVVKSTQMKATKRKEAVLAKIEAGEFLKANCRKKQTGTCTKQCH